MAAWCASAGRDYNEDNFQLKDNLSDPDWGVIHTDDIIALDEKGALLVVCDGMGGMNAGHIASDLAVKTIKEWFAADRLLPHIMATPETMMQHIGQAIIAADDKIKEAGQQNNDYKGMGSTIVLAWIVGRSVYIGWCGDSRAYRFNPVFGLEQLSHDHSYVQELVDNGKLSKELAFGHPDSNIVTRSLGDTRHNACPDVRCFPLYSDDTLLLCSDGLSGVLRDEEIESILSTETGSMRQRRNALWTASEKAGWTDNVTIALCQIVSGADTAQNINKKAPVEKTVKQPCKKQKLIIIIILAIIFLLGIVFGIGYYAGKGSWQLSPDDSDSISPPDTTQVAGQDTAALSK